MDDTEIKTGRGYPKYIPIEQLLELKNKKLTNEQIANIIGCSKSNVFQRLRPYNSKINELELHKRHRADILTSVQKRIVEGITDDKIADAPLNQLSVAYGILYDKERLERNKSTQNLSVNSLVEHHEKQLADLEQNLTAELEGL